MTEPIDAVVPASGRWESSDMRTVIDWAIPEWSDRERMACSLGVHIATRKLVVASWINYFTQVEHLYCACGTRRWLRYNQSDVECDTVQPSAMRDWIALHLQMQERFTDLLARSRP